MKYLIPALAATLGLFLAAGSASAQHGGFRGGSHGHGSSYGHGGGHGHGGYVSHGHRSHGIISASVYGGYYAEPVYVPQVQSGLVITLGGPPIYGHGHVRHGHSHGHVRHHGHR